MSGKTDKKFRNLIDMLDGAKNKGEEPPVRVLLYNVAKDAFEDIRYSTQKLDPSKKTLLLIHGTMAVTTNFVMDQISQRWQQGPQTITPWNVAARRAHFARRANRQ